MGADRRTPSKWAYLSKDFRRRKKKGVRRQAPTSRLEEALLKGENIRIIGWATISARARTRSAQERSRSQDEARADYRGADSKRGK